MHKRQKFVLFLNRTTIYGIMLGFIIGLMSIFVSGIMQSYLIFIGGSIIVSTIIVFLFGLSMITMETITDGPDNYHKLDQNIHSMQSQHKLSNRLY